MPPPAADLTARVDQLLAQARAAHHAFTAGSASTDRATSGAGALGGETWASASLAVASLEAQLDISLAALGELDITLADRRIALAGGADSATDAVIAAQGEVAGYVDADSAALSRWDAALDD